MDCWWEFSTGRMPFCHPTNGVIALNTNATCRQRLWQSSRLAAFLQADARPVFSWPRSASTAQSRVWLDLPNGHFWITAAVTWWWSPCSELHMVWLTHEELQMFVVYSSVMNLTEHFGQKNRTADWQRSRVTLRRKVT